MDIVKDTQAEVAKARVVVEGVEQMEAVTG
jgi:hypothetical protein